MKEEDEKMRKEEGLLRISLHRPDTGFTWMFKTD